MKKERRWIKSVLAESARSQIVMPWARRRHHDPADTGKAPRQDPRAAHG